MLIECHSLQHKDELVPGIWKCSHTQARTLSTCQRLEQKMSVVGPPFSLCSEALEEPVLIATVMFGPSFSVVGPPFFLCSEALEDPILIATVMFGPSFSWQYFSKLL